MHAHHMKTAPAMVMRRNDHLSSGSGGPPSGPCQKPGARNKLRVAAAKPLIHRSGNNTFIGKGWADESGRGEGFIGGRLTDWALAAGEPVAGARGVGAVRGPPAA